MPLHESLLFLLGIWSSIWFLLLIISEDANISLSIFILCACKRWKMWTTCLNIVLKGFLSFYLLFIFYLGFFLLLLSLGFICCIMGDAGACSRSFIFIVGVWLLQLFFGWFGQKSNGTLREVMYTMEDFAEIVRVILLALFIQCVHTIIHGSYQLCWRILGFSMNWLVLLYHVHQEVNNVADWWTKNGVNQLSITFYVWFCISFAVLSFSSFALFISTTKWSLIHLSSKNKNEEFLCNDGMERFNLIIINYKTAAGINSTRKGQIR